MADDWGICCYRFAIASIDIALHDEAAQTPMMMVNTFLEIISNAEGLRCP